MSSSLTYNQCFQHLTWSHGTANWQGVVFSGSLFITHAPSTRQWLCFLNLKCASCRLRRHKTHSSVLCLHWTPLFPDSPQTPLISNSSGWLLEYQKLCDKSPYEAASTCSGKMEFTMFYCAKKVFKKLFAYFFFYNGYILGTFWILPHMHQYQTFYTNVS